MNAKVLIAGLIVAGSLLAQPPGGPRGRGPGGFGGPGGPGGPGRGPGAAATVTGAPYAAVEVRTSQQTLATGGVILRTERTNVFRDAQGRVRRETTRTTPDGQTATRVTISDPVAGMVHELDARNKTAFSRPARFPTQAQIDGANQAQTSRAPRRAAAQTDANVKRETLAAQSMNGIIASGSRVTRTIPAGTIGNSQPIQSVRETWMADDLKVPLMTKTSDPRTGTSTTELTNINRSQPDPSLFLIPADYTIKKGPGGGGRGPRPVAQEG